MIELTVVDTSPGIRHEQASPNMECSIYIHISENMDASRGPNMENMERLYMVPLLYETRASTS
jgi:hypothetical protein